METVDCVLCGPGEQEIILQGRDNRHRITDHAFSIVQCGTCGLRFVNPRPAKDEMAGFYPVSYRPRRTVSSPDHLARRSGKYRNPRMSWLFANPWHIPLRAGQRVLDIGCGAGEFLIWVREQGCTGYGMDIDPMTSSVLKEEMDLNVTCSDIDAVAPFEDGFFDVVVMRHSLEHVHNPLKALREVYRIMKQGGLLVIGVPNIGGILPGVTGPFWRGLDLPRHIFHFTPATLRKLLGGSGFSVERLYYEFKFSRDSLRDWMTARYGLSLTVPKAVSRLLGFAVGILGKGEWFVCYARKE